MKKQHLTTGVFILLLLTNHSIIYSQDEKEEFASYKTYLSEATTNPLVINIEQKTKRDLPTTDSLKKSTSSAFAILNTTGRTLLDSETSDPICGQQKGNSYIVVRVMISPNGEVLNAIAGINDGNSKTKNASQCLIDWAKSEALKLNFSEIQGDKNQSGIIIFDIREK